MAESLEPHRDPDTIKSFKRTINAAILLVAARGQAPTRSEKTWIKWVFFAGGVVIAKLSGLSIHDIGNL
jgi:hypothetical protein